ncbi:MAG: aminotransferase class I/II-fold pyridoxal phosphate-dependent enzyme [Kiritimatiellae bacterium]|nr:aminotransferase class I/II-fold pyridoxal phosphate-dependent enzyme [Kiritimatiellia bacterium]
MLESISPAPPDAILGLTEAFKKDTNPDKINLGVGVYQDDTGTTPILEAVKAAEEKLLKEETSKSYLSISGSPQYTQCVQTLLFGDGHEILSSGRAKTAHTPGGTGALRVGADFLNQSLPDASIWVSTPTWANHKGIFSASGFEIKDYPYYDPQTHGIEFGAMKKVLSNIPENDIVLLHVCCHNPTGVDLESEQWKEIAAIAKTQRWIPFLDFAYQGFGASLEEDRRGLLGLLNIDTPLFVANSFSKNVGLYRERTGALTVIAQDAFKADAIFSHIKATIRTNYSNPPAHGGSIVETILNDDTLRQQWTEELTDMRNQIASVRSTLVQKLAEKDIPQDFSFIEKQKGMFSFSGLSDEQVTYLRENKAIYIVKGGRINVAGVTPQNIDYLCESIREAIQQ